MPDRRRLRPRTTHLLGALTLLLALLVAAPLILMALAAFKDAGSVFDGSPIATEPTLANFAHVLGEVPLLRYMGNSLLVAVAATAGTLVFSSMGAFALARLHFRGRDTLFFAFFSTIFVSVPLIIVPLYLVVRELGLLESLGGVVAPMMFQAFALFLLRQFYLTLPDELDDAARLDGCGPLRIFWSIALPLSRPVMAALAIFVFLGAWNAFLWPLTVARDPSLWVVQIGIASLQGEFAGAWGAILAASTVASIPTIVLFLIFQRQIIESIKTSGLKG
ncbi:carbohydrate ABC transporter permease [Georgenia alba]|uniref:Carbohydrate ABC transporter permease n=1 Tax=Georgenia alba TaxID=2233858 RepID=A0ABW2QA65_9MICO